VPVNFSYLLCLKDKTSTKVLQKESLKTIEKCIRNKSSKSSQQSAFSVLVVPIFSLCFPDAHYFCLIQLELSTTPIHLIFPDEVLKKTCVYKCPIQKI